jgi:hypothetical protein
LAKSFEPNDLEYVEVFSVGNHTLAFQGHPEFNYINMRLWPRQVPELPDSDLSLIKPVWEIIRLFAAYDGPLS